jgi:hypothetical protein
LEGETENLTQPIFAFNVSCRANICGYYSVVGGLSAALSVFFIVYKVGFRCKFTFGLILLRLYFKISTFAFFLQAIQMCRRRRAGAPRSPLSIVELVLVAFGVLWWIAGATTATIYAERADNDGLKEKDSRTAVWSLSWANVFLFSVLTGVEIIKYRTHPRKIRYPAVGLAGTTIGASPPPSYFPHHSVVVTAPPAGPVPTSPFMVPGYPTAPSSTVQMYGGYPLATEPPLPTTHSR